MALTGPQIGQAANAITAAYTRPELRRVVRVCMDEDFDSLVTDGPFAQQVFELVVWANRKGRASELIVCAYNGNKSNEKLGVLIAELGTTWPPATQSTPFLTPPLELEWVKIPAGEFWMGSDQEIDPNIYDDEAPRHCLKLAEYFIAKYPITNIQYQQYVEAVDGRLPDHWQGGIIPHGRESHPVVQVSWHEACAYCEWASKVTGRTIRLPSEAEWEKAARGLDGRTWPWGEQTPTKGLCNFGGNVGDTTSVNLYVHGASPFGVLDMAGNVWEWTRSVWGSVPSVPAFRYPYEPSDGRENLKAPGSEMRVQRGGSFSNPADDARCALRGWSHPDFKGENVGFRVVLTL